VLVPVLMPVVLVPGLLALVAVLLLLMLVLGSREGIAERVSVLVLLRRSVSSSRVGWRRTGGILMLRGPGRGGRLIVSSLFFLLIQCCTLTSVRETGKLGGWVASLGWCADKVA
jgi:hypothetical protein